MKVTLLAGALFWGLMAAGLSAGDYSIRQLKQTHSDGYYKAGEEVVVTGQLFKGKAPAVEEKLCIVTKWEGREVDRKEIPSGGKPFSISYKSDKPGWVYFGFMVKGPDG